MALLAYNQTGAPVVLAAGTPATTIPANGVVNVTSELTGLVGGDYVLLQAQTPASIVYAWSTGVAEFATAGLTIGSTAIPASGTVAGVLSTGAQTIAGAKSFTSIITTTPTALSTPASGTGITLGYNGDHRRGWFKITVGFAAWTAAAATQDIILAVIPAKCRILSVISDTTAALTLGAATLNLKVGITGTLAGFIASHDVKTAAVTKGLADADLGTLLTRATAIQGGSLSSWTTTTNLTCSLTSGSTNLGTGTVTSLTTGSTTFYVAAEMM